MTPFRDATSILEAQATALAASRRAELDLLPTGHRSVFVRRTARIGFGVAGTLCAVVIAAAMLLETGGYTSMLVLSWPIAGATYVATHIIAAAVLRRRLAAVVARTGEPFHDLAALAAVGPRDVERTLSARRPHASYAWPLVAVTLLGPHTFHLFVAVTMLGFTEDGFDRWMVGASLFALHVFIYGFYVAWQFPLRRRIGWPIVISGALGVFPFVLSGPVALITAAVIALCAYLPMRTIMDGEARELAAAAELG